MYNLGSINPEGYKPLLKTTGMTRVRIIANKNTNKSNWGKKETATVRNITIPAYSYYHHHNHSGDFDDDSDHNIVAVLA